MGLLYEISKIRYNIRNRKNVERSFKRKSELFDDYSINENTENIRMKNIEDGDIEFIEIPEDKYNRKNENQIIEGDFEYDSIDINPKDYENKEIDFYNSLNTKIRIEESPMARGRHEKAVYIKNGDKEEKRTSNIMVGKKEINLPNGEYVSMNEFKVALKEYLLSKKQENVVFKIKDSEMEYVQPSEIEEQVLNEIANKSNIKIGEGSDRVINQETASMWYKDKETNEYIKKGILFLGNGKLKLPCDEYISTEEIKNAFNKYILLEEKPQLDIIDFRREQKPKDRILAMKNERYKVKDIQKGKFKIWPVISNAVMTLKREIQNFINRRGLLTYEER